MATKPTKAITIMHKPDIRTVITQTGIFKGISPDIVEDMLAHNHQRVYAKGESLFNAGDVAKNFFVILSGWVKLSRLSKEGDEVTINIFGAGESFAEAAVFKETMTYPVDAKAATKVEVLAISRQWFVEKIKKDTAFALNMLGAISARQHTLVQQLEQVTIRSAPQRVGTFLLRFAAPTSANKLVVELPYNKTLIAARLNIKPETFSRALQKLKAYGVVFDGSRAIIADKNRLIDFCDITDV